MATNRRQRERVALALTRPGRLHQATPQLVEQFMIAADSLEVYQLLFDLYGSHSLAHAATADVCKAAGVACP